MTAVKEPTASTLLEVMNAYVQMVTLGMGESVMVCRKFIILHVLTIVQFRY